MAAQWNDYVHTHPEAWKTFRWKVSTGIKVTECYVLGRKKVTECCRASCCMLCASASAFCHFVFLFACELDHEYSSQRLISSKKIQATSGSSAFSLSRNRVGQHHQHIPALPPEWPKPTHYHMTIISGVTLWLPHRSQECASTEPVTLHPSGSSQHSPVSIKVCVGCVIVTPKRRSLL